MAQEGVDDEITVTAKDIAGFNKTGPWSKSDKKVTINFSKDFAFYEYFKSVTVNIEVVGPEDYDDTIEIDEHPVVETSVAETRQSVTIDLLKVDSETNEPLTGAVFGLYAAADISDIDGNVLYEEYDLIQTVVSDGSDESHAIAFDNLPNDAYVDPGNRGQIMYYIKEITPPPGYKAVSPDRAYYFKAGLGDDKVHCEFLHTWAGDDMAAEGDNDSTHYITDSSIVKNAPGGLGLMKLWDDHGNAAGKRPKEITVTIKDNNVKPAATIETLKLTEENNWSATSEVLSQADVRGMSDAEFKDRYTVEESYVDGYDHDQTKNAALTKMNGRYVFKLDNKGQNYTESRVKKVWNDQNDAEKKRPLEIKVQLYQDGKAYGDPVVLNEGNDWSYETGLTLPAYDENTGLKYKYTWEEPLTDIITNDPDTGYTISYVTDEEAHLTTITNTLQNGVSVTKNWEDNGDEADMRVDHIEVQLYQNGVSMGDKYKFTLNEDNDWTQNVPDVPVRDANNNPYEYTWKEIAKEWTITDADADQIGYLPTYEEITMDGLPTTRITNTLYTKGSIKAYKELDPDDIYFDHGNPRFTFHLTGKNWKGEAVDMEKTVEFTKEDLQKYKQQTHKEGDKVRKEVVFEDVEMGEYTITESGTENMYELDKVVTDGDNVTLSEDKKSAVVVLGKDKKTGTIYSTGTVGFQNVSYKGSIKVIKYSEDGQKKPLAGVAFSLYDKDGKEVAAKETDDNGEILFDKLKRGTYTLKERKTIPGHNLLKDAVSVTIPKTFTAEEAKAQKVDTSKAKYNPEDDTYDFYDVTYEISNHEVPGVPLTGAFEGWWMYLPIVLAMVLFIGVGIYQMKRKKKPVK